MMLAFGAGGGCGGGSLIGGGEKLGKFDISKKVLLFKVEGFGSDENY